jgi:hypothetical protein
MNDYLAGMCASAAGTCLQHPFDVVKTRAQVSGSTTLAALKVTAQKGHFFKGLAPALSGYGALRFHILPFANAPPPPLQSQCTRLPSGFMENR